MQKNLLVNLDNYLINKKNTQYKAKFIAGMMEKHPKRNILWLDVDSSICQYPAILQRFSYSCTIFYS